jgi:sulfate transport system permease protein
MTTTRRVLPGFRLSLGLVLLYLSAMVLIPLLACLVSAASLTPGQFWAAVSSPRAVAAYQLTFGASLAAAAINVVLGLLIAWVLVRYEFPLRRFFDAIVDLPFALPTAVAGLVFTDLFAPHGWYGRWLVPLGHRGELYARGGGAGAGVYRLSVCGAHGPAGVGEHRHGPGGGGGSAGGEPLTNVAGLVVLPMLTPALLTGFALSFARALGEYGSVVFVSGNRPGQTEIAPVLIVGRLEAFQYAEATAIAVVLLTVSFALLILINRLQRTLQGASEA